MNDSSDEALTPHIELQASRLAKLSDEELRIKVAELCGWKRHTDKTHRLSGSHSVEIGWLRNGVWRDDWNLPFYDSDLNAMHEAEKMLGGMRGVPTSGDVSKYFDHLIAITGCETFAIFATARQRAEAFVLTLDQSPGVNSKPGVSVESKDK